MTAAHVQAAPAPALRDAVVRLTGYRDRAAGPVRFTEMPGTFVPVILDLDEGWRVGDARRPGAPLDRFGSFVAGLTGFSVAVEHAGSAHCLQVDLRPRAARRLLGVPMHELADRTAPLPPEVGWALARVTSRERPARVGDLARELGWSHRRLIARFRDEVGMPPKLVARVARLERARRLIAAEPALGLARVAARCGFADQAHLAREVGAHAATTPTGLRSSPVNSVQDPAAGAA